MALTSHAFQLPGELMSTVIDWVGIEDLVPLSAVSSKWRAVAHSHRLFWHDIRLEALSSTALSFFHARLCHSRGRDIHLTIRLLNNTPSGRIKAIVLPTVTRHLSQIVNLVIFIDYDVHADVLDALKVPAPLLESLDLGFFTYPVVDRPAVLLAPDLFGGSSPKLISVTLTDIKLPDQQIAAFETVKSFVVFFTDPGFIVRNIFRQFPALTSLRVVGDPRMDGENVPHHIPKIPRLSILEVCMPMRRYERFFDNIPGLTSIPDVRCWQPRVDHARILLEHLDGPIEMEFCGPHQASNTLEIRLRAPGRGRTRTFVEYMENLAEAEAASALFGHAFAERVTMLRISSQLAYLAPLFAELPSCRTLEVALDDDAGRPSSLREGFPEAPLRLPALTTLAVKAVGSSVGKISADHLSTYLAALVGHTGNRPALRLESVYLHNSSSSLSHDFDME